MKRLLALTLCLVLCASAALAEFNWTLWQIPVPRAHNSTVTMLNETDAAVFYLDWDRDTDMTAKARRLLVLHGREPAVNVTGGQAWSKAFCHVIPFADGSCGVLVIPTLEEGLPERTAALYRLEGDGLSEPETLSGTYIAAYGVRGGAALTEQLDEGYRLVLLDFETGERHELPLGDNRLSPIRADRSDAGDWWVYMAPFRYEDDCYVVHAAPDGAMTAAVVNGLQGLFADPLTGGAFAWAAHPSDITADLTVFVLNAACEVTGSHQLTAKNLVKYIRAIYRDPVTGEVHLYGSGVAASRSVYRLFHLTASEQLRQTAVDVRDFSYRSDNDLRVILTPQGTPMALGRGSSDESDVLIPFDALPRAKDPGFRLR